MGALKRLRKQRGVNSRRIEKTMRMGFAGAVHGSV